MNSNRKDWAEVRRAWILANREAYRTGTDDEPVASAVVPRRYIRSTTARTIPNTLRKRNLPDCRFLDFRRYCVLIAEDMATNRAVLCQMLKPTMIAIDCAGNGREAVRMFCENPAKYALILMDIEMPVMDGYEATRTIRSLGIPHAGRIPIIAVSSKSSRGDIDNCLAAGMNAHIAKPIDPARLFETMKEYLAIPGV